MNTQEFIKFVSEKKEQGAKDGYTVYRQLPCKTPDGDDISEDEGFPLIPTKDLKKILQDLSLTAYYADGSPSVVDSFFDTALNSLSSGFATKLRQITLNEIEVAGKENSLTSLCRIYTIETIEAVMAGQDVDAGFLKSFSE